MALRRLAIGHLGIVEAIREWNKMEKQLAKLNVPLTPKGFRLPADATPEVREMSDWAFQRLVDVAAGRVSKEKAAAILKAAIEIRKEICGPIVQKQEVTVTGRLEHLLTRSLEAPSSNVLETTAAPLPLPAPQREDPRATDEYLAAKD